MVTLKWLDSEPIRTHVKTLRPQCRYSGGQSEGEPWPIFEVRFQACQKSKPESQTRKIPICATDWSVLFHPDHNFQDMLNMFHKAIHTGLYTLVYTHGSIHTGLYTLVYTHWSIHTGLYTLVYTHWS